MASSSSSSSDEELIHKERSETDEIVFYIDDKRAKLSLYLPDGKKIAEKLAVIKLRTESVENGTFDITKHVMQIIRLIQRNPEYLFRIDFSFISKTIYKNNKWIFNYNYERLYKQKAEFFNTIIKRCLQRFASNETDIDKETQTLIERFIENGYSFNFISNDGVKSLLPYTLIPMNGVYFIAYNLFLIHQKMIIRLVFTVISEHLASVQKVISLKFHTIYGLNDNINIIVDFIEKHDTIKELCIIHTNIIGNTKPLFTRISSLNREFYHIDLSKCLMFADDMKDVGLFIQQNNHLYALSLSFRGIPGGVSSKAYFKALRDGFINQNNSTMNTNLVNLSLKSCRITPKTLEILCDCFKYMNLKQLSLKYNDLLLNQDLHEEQDDITPLTKFFETIGKNNMISLNLSGVSVQQHDSTEELFRNVSEWLKDNLTIRILKLDKNHFKLAPILDVRLSGIYGGFIERLTQLSDDQSRLEKLSMKNNGLMTDMKIKDVPFFEFIQQKNRFLRKLYLQDSESKVKVKNERIADIVFSLLQYNYSMTRLDMHSTKRNTSENKFLERGDYYTILNKEDSAKSASLYLLKEFCLRRNMRMMKNVSQRLLESLQLELGIQIPEDVAYEKRVGLSPYLYTYKDIPFNNDILSHIVDDIPIHHVPCSIVFVNQKNSFTRSINNDISKEKYWINKLSKKLNDGGLNRYVETLALDWLDIDDDEMILLIDSLMFKIDNPLLSGLKFDVGNDVLLSLSLNNNKVLEGKSLPHIGNLVLKSRIQKLSLHLFKYEGFKVFPEPHFFIEMIDIISSSDHLTSLSLSLKNRVIHNDMIKEKLFQQISLIKLLGILEIEHTDLSSFDDISKSLEPLLNMKNLRELKMVEIHIYGKQIIPIMNVISKSKLTTFVFITEKIFLNSHIDGIINALSENKTLLHIDMNLKSRNPTILNTRLKELTERNKQLALHAVSLDDDYAEMSQPLPKKSSSGKKKSSPDHMQYVEKITFYIDLLIYNDQFIKDDPQQKHELKMIYDSLLAELYTYTKSSRADGDYRIFVDHTVYIIQTKLQEYRNKYPLFYK